MDSPAIKFAGAIALFLELALTSLAAKPTPENGSDKVPGVGQRTPVQLRGFTPQLEALAVDVQRALPPQLSASPTKVEELMTELADNCSSLARQLVALPNGQTVDAESLHHHFLHIKGILSHEIARHHWIGMSKTIQEVEATNVRLGANRGADISDCAGDIDLAFKAILHGPETPPNVWRQIVGRVQQLENLQEEQMVLSTLHFWTMETRQRLIPKEHENTFSWILDQSSVFATWLGSNEPLFWISGKPGSGKSTVMKYIAENGQTLELLRTWAGRDKLVTANFYFWSSAGNELQKSGEGLVRSILVQILRQCPDLGAVAFPSRPRYQRKWKPTLEELQSGLHRLLVGLKPLRMKFCFFIDGLDEFHGDPAEAIQLIQQMSSASDSAKVCVSSRPWPEFEAAFGIDTSWKLYMHELTRGDMQKYVQDLLLQRGVQSPPLVLKIVQKAEGVFLWVFLVVRDTEQLNGDEILNTLPMIPNTLDEYLYKTISDTTPEQRASTAKIFQTALAAVDKLPLRQYFFIAAADASAVLPEQESESEVQLDTLPSAAEMEETLRSLSHGLLRPNSAHLQPVEFLHRTVADFLHSDTMARVFNSWCDFDVHQAICASSLKVLMASPPLLPAEEAILLTSLHIFLVHVGSTADDMQGLLLDQLWDWLDQMEKRQSNQALMMRILGPGNFWAFDANPKFAFLYHCMSYGLGVYVCRQLPTHQGGFKEPADALLSGSLSWDPRVRSGPPAPPLIKSIEPLFNIGLDPNVAWGDCSMSFWQQLLRSCYSKHLKGILTEEDHLAVTLALGHGAKQMATVEVLNNGLKKLTARELIAIIFG